MAAVRAVFNTGGPRDRDTAIRDVARELGYRRTGANIHETLDNAIRNAVRRGILHNDGQLLSMNCRSITDYTPDDLVKHLLAAIDRTWLEQEVVIYMAASYLGFRRVGPIVHDTLTRTISLAIRRNLLERDGTQLRRI